MMNIQVLLVWRERWELPDPQAVLVTLAQLGKLASVGWLVVQDCLVSRELLACPDHVADLVS